MPIDPRERVCAVCAEPLNIQEHPLLGTQTFAHKGLQDRDHPPVPVLPGALTEVVYNCDFCGADRVTEAWRYPCANFDSPPPRQGDKSLGDWVACRECHRAIRDDRWSNIQMRTIRYMGQKHGMTQLEAVEFIPYMRELWKRFRRHRTGEPIPLHDPQHSQRSP